MVMKVTKSLLRSRFSATWPKRRMVPLPMQQLHQAREFHGLKTPVRGPTISFSSSSSSSKSPLSAPKRWNASSSWTPTRGITSCNNGVFSQKTFSTSVNGETTSKEDGKNAMEIVQGAIDALEGFGTQLQTASQLVDQSFDLKKDNFNTIPITLPQIVLHSRDATLEEFQSPQAVQARQLVWKTAQQVDEQLRGLAEEYTQTIQPQMERATRLCQETPCGGATWDVDEFQQLAKGEDAVATPGGNIQVNISGMKDTPCGRLQSASLTFLQITHDTQPQVTMGSRALVILTLAQETLEAPLRHIKNHGTAEQNQTIQQAFTSQVIPTPWVRSPQEYEQLLQLQKELKK